MGIVKTNNLSYRDVLQCDGAFSLTHNNYGKSPMFNGVEAKSIAIKSRKNSLSSKEKVEDVIGSLYSFDGTEKNYKNEDRLTLWKYYWEEYINVFDKLGELLPDSIVTVFVGRQAIEIGFKYLLLLKTGQIVRGHDLGELSNKLLSKYSLNYSPLCDVCD